LNAFANDPMNPSLPAPVPTQDDRVVAAVAHGMTFVEGGILGPLCIYILKKDENQFIAFHALQSLYFGLLFLVLTVLTCGVGAAVLVWPYLVFEGIAALRAYEGQWYELPIVGRYAREKHPGPPVA
jgi:uncharacterized membrane protein